MVGSSGFVAVGCVRVLLVTASVAVKFGSLGNLSVHAFGKIFFRILNGLFQ